MLQTNRTIRTTPVPHDIAEEKSLVFWYQISGKIVLNILLNVQQPAFCYCQHIYYDRNSW
jgi:hypothetical protein